MNKNMIDARGLACPAPVLKTKKMIENENPESIKVIVDNEAARQNVSRFLESQNFDVSVEQEGEDFRITGKRGEQEAGKLLQPEFQGLFDRDLLASGYVQSSNTAGSPAKDRPDHQAEKAEDNEVDPVPPEQPLQAF